MKKMAKQDHENTNNIEKQIQKQMGCMAGFFHLFLSAKRLSSPSSPAVDDSKSETVSETTNVTEHSVKQIHHQHAKTVTSPIRSPAPEPSTPTKSPILPVFELKQGTRSSWKFAKEAPRLSLDSRAIVDAKGSLHSRDIRKTNKNAAEAVDDDYDQQRMSTSVIARLMGLDTLQNNQDSENGKAPQLRRSASESRVSKEFFNYQFIDPNSFKLKQQQQQKQQSSVDLKEYNARHVRTQQKVPKGGVVLHRKSFFDSADFFPEPKQQCVSIYYEIEKRLKMRGIDEPSSKDLESLKHILEALQLKGLLHSNNYQRNLNFVYERDESPIVVMKPGRTRSPVRDAGVRRNLNNSRGRTSSPTRSERSVSSSSPTIRQRRPLSVETQRRLNERTTKEQQPQRRSTSPSVRSPRINSPRRIGHDNQILSQSPGNRKPRAEICSHNKETLMISNATEDESSTLSDSVSTWSQKDSERLSKAEEYREGRSMLERCDNLLQSIAEMTTTSSAELQPSPVSVLDSSFYNEESSPSPVMKRSLEFKEIPAELDDDIWSPTTSEENREDGDYTYISEVFRAWKYLPEDLDVFSLLEKQQHIKGRDTSKVSILKRKLIFDTINEILDWKRQLPPWKTATWGTMNSSSSSLEDQIWSEFQKIRERENSEQQGLLEVICGVLKKDLAGDAIKEWGDWPIEMSEAVLDIERLIFKDLIGETIQDLAAAAFSVKCNNVPAFCRKLVF